MYCFCNFPVSLELFQNEKKKKNSYSSFKSLSPAIQPSINHSTCLPLKKIKIRNILLELKFIVMLNLGT